MTADIIQKALGHYGCTTNLLEMRFIVICLLGFSGFMRRSDLRSIQIKHTWQSFFLTPKLINFDKGTFFISIEGYTQHVPSPGHKKSGWNPPNRWWLSDQPPRKKKTTKIGHNAVGTNPLSHTGKHYGKIFFFHMLEPIWDDTLTKSDYSLHYLRYGVLPKPRKTTFLIAW